MRQTLSVLSLLLALLALVPIGAQAQNAGGAFSCDGTFYQVRQSGTGATAFSVLYTVDRSAATYTTSPITGGTFGTTGTLSVNGTRIVVNGLAYNSQDGYLYALTYPADNGTPTVVPRLYKIGLGGVEDLGATNLPVAQFATGAFDKTGHYYVTTRNSTTATYRGNLYRFDLNSATPLSATVVQMRNNTGGTITNTATADYFDIAYNPSDNKIYGVFADNVVYRLDLYDASNNPTTGNTNTTTPTTARITQLGTTAGSQAIGTAFFDVSGRLFAYANGTAGAANGGTFYLVNTTTGAYTQLSTIDGVSNSDGASCINPNQRIDVTKEVSNVATINATTFDITYTIRVRNTGTVTDNYVQVSDLLRGSGATTANTTFPTATSTTITVAPVVTNLDGSNLTANAGFTGVSGAASLLSGTQGLTAGQRAIITYTVRVVFPSAPSGTFNNTAYGTSTSSSPNNGYTQVASNGALLPPIDLEADDASTNSSTFAGLRADLSDVGDTPAPTPVTFAPSITGTVFEDVNYGGGLGRSQSASLGIGRPNARVELYTVATVGGIDVATYNSFQTTAADGTYAFTGLTAGNRYVVRVVNNTVTSSRTGYTSAAIPVQTYRTQVTAAAGTTPDLSRVGGEDPSRVDAGNGGTGTTLAVLNVPSAAGVIGTIAESQAPITLSANNAPAVNVDFGYNFDTVVNTNDVATVSGNNAQGSLRQFITNSNLLGGESTLTQVYTATGGATTALTTGLETSIFMIPNGSAVAGQVAGLTSTFAGGAATINLLSALPTVSGALTAVDGRTQTRSTGDTNAAVTTAGSESTGPEVILNLNNQTGLAFSGANEQLLGLGVTGSAAASSGVLVNGTATGLSVTNNTIYSNGINVTVLSGATGANISNNIIRNSTQNNGGGIVAQSGTSGNVFSQNTYGGNNGLAIDLTNGVTTSGDGVTLNDNGDTDTGANGRINFPIITSATIVSGTVVVKGYARPNVNVELYLAAADPTGFGEGRTYLTSFTQGAAAGTVGSVTTGAAATYGSGLINGLSQGTDNTNTFTYTFTPTAAQLTQLQASGALLTSTATLTPAAGGNFGTSEFSGNVRVNLPPTANNITNDAVLTTSAATVLNPNLVATPNGPGVTITSYAVTNLSGVNGTLRYNGANVTTATVITDLTLLTYQPTPGFAGNATFQYNATDSNGFLSNTATYTIPVSAVADVVAAFPGTNPTSVTAGAGLALTVSFTNAGLNDAAGVIRTVQLPAGLGTVNVTNNGTYNNTTGLVSFTPTPTTLTTTGNLNANITISAVPAGLTSLTAVANISTTTSENGVTANNAATVVIPVTPSFDLATTLTGPTSLVAGTEATYLVTTRNNGPSAIGSPAEGTSAATGAVQTVNLPANLTGVFVSNGGVYNAATGVVTFPDVALASGQSVVNTISFSVGAATTFTPRADVAKNSTLTGTDPVATNNTAYLNGSTAASPASTTVTGTAGTTAATTANLYLTVTGPSQVTGSSSATATYTVKQGNNGLLAASGVQTTVLLPTGLPVANFTINGVVGTLSGTTISFTLAGGVATYSQTTGLLTFATVSGTQAPAGTPESYAIMIPVAATASSFDVTATVGSTTADIMPADNVATVQTEVLNQTDVAISLTNASLNAISANAALGSPIGGNNLLAGQTVSYEVLASNTTNVPARNVQQTVTLPLTVDVTTLRVNGLAGSPSPAAAGVYIFTNGASYNVNTGKLSLAAIANLMGGAIQSTAVTFTAPADNSSSIVRLPISAAISTTTPETNAANNSASLNTNLNSAQDVSVAIKGPSQAVVGNPVFYTVATTNNGPSANGTITTSVTLPAALDPTTLRINNAAATSVSGSVYTFGSGGTAITYTATTGVVAYPATGLSLAKQGLSTVSTIQFVAPDVTLLNAVASVTTSGTDLDLTNNTAQAITPLSNPALGLGNPDLTTLVSASTTNAPTGTSETITIRTTNNSTVTAAPNVTQTLVLPAGIVSNGGTVTTTNGGVYDDNTGVVTYNVGTLATSGIISNTATFALPTNASGSNNPSYALTVTGTSFTSLTETDVTNNTSTVNVTVGAKYDLAAAISGPASAPAGATVTYTVALSNNGPSQASAVTGTVTLPAGVTSYTLNGVATTGSGTISIRTSANMLAGVTELYQLSFTAPAGSFTTQADIATTGTVAETNVAPNTATITTNTYVAPVADDIVNEARRLVSGTTFTGTGPIGNTAGPVAISSLVATVGSAAIASYNITAIPAVGTLYVNGVAVTAPRSLTTTEIGQLTYDPAATGTQGSADPKTLASGNDFFLFTATDNNGLTSNVARYTIPVGQDNASVYTVIAKGGNANQYQNGDVVAYGIDPNGATYNGSGLVYNANGTTATGTVNNGLQSGSITAANITTLAAVGIVYNTTTGQFTVSDRTKLPRAGQTIPVTVTTVDLFGGVTTQTINIVLGANPLPVELTDFSAKAANQVDALLHWATATELNNDHFVVERSLNGSTFAAVGTVRGKGTSTSATAYSFTDAGVARLAQGTVYYRLQQVDADGTVSYSPVRQVAFAQGKATVSLYPNPSQGNATLDLSGLAVGQYQVQVVDLAGRVLRKLQLAAVAAPLDLQDLPQGAYVVLVQGAGISQTLPLIRR